MELTLRDGGTLHYEVHGDCGEWLIFLNGALGTTMAWAEVAPLIAARRRLVLVDFRDQGQSSRLGPGYDAGIHCSDLIELLDHLAIERISMLGISYGGQVALRFVGDHAERLERLLLASIAPCPSAHLLAVGSAWRRLAIANLGHELLDSVAALVYSVGFHESHGELLAGRRDLLLPRLTPEWFAAFVRLSDSARDFDYRAALAAIPVPTLLLCGAEDALMAPETVFGMATSIPNCTCLAIPGAGHGLFVEAPRAFASAVLGFTAL